MKYAIMLCFLHQIIFASDLLKLLNQEITNLQERTAHYNGYRELKQFIYDAPAFQFVHSAYKNAEKKIGSISMQEQDLLENYFIAHMKKEKLELNLCQRRIEPFAFSLAIGSYVFATYLYYYCATRADVSPGECMFIKMTCIPLLCALATLVLYDAINPSKSIHHRINALDKNYKTAFPHRVPLSWTSFSYRPLEHPHIL